MTTATTKTVEVTVRVAGTPDEVFPYFTDPEKYRRWKGLDAELDARPGGIYRVWMPRGLVLEGEYRVVERPMTMRRRAQGRSKKGGNLVYGARYARVVVGTWWRERKTIRSSTTNLTRNSTA